MINDNDIKNKTEIPRTTSGFLMFLFKKILEKKKYWLLLIWCFLVALGFVLFLTGNGALLPAIYMAF